MAKPKFKDDPFEGAANFEPFKVPPKTKPAPKPKTKSKAEIEADFAWMRESVGDLVAALDAAKARLESGAFAGPQEFDWLTDLVRDIQRGPGEVHQ
jgi:hypothetical protein